MKPSWIVLACKRALDLAGGIVGLLLFALTFPVVGLLIRLESAGPVLYKQVRVGMNRREKRAGGGGGRASGERRSEDVGGRPFSIWKYRTMRIDAESAGPQLCSKGGDPRITRVGRWLRALHIDEIPQFINVVMGDMSLIGPRPERPHFTRQYAGTLPHYADRTHNIRPGLSGLAQILLGYDDTPDSVLRKSHYDLSYRASFCSFGCWIRMESWIFFNTFAYLLKRPTFEGDAIREPDALRRAKLLPFQSRVVAGPASRSTVVTLSFERGSRPVVLTGRSGAELAGHLAGLDFEGMPCPEVYVRPRGHLDLEDMGFLLRLAHAVKGRGGRICLRSPDRQVRDMLKEMHLDSVVDIEHEQRAVRNFLTVDVECWFHAYHMREVAPKCTWHRQPTRIVEDMERLLELMRAHRTTATFFVLGWVADRFPEVVRMIDREGHEIGTHGYHHDLITEMTPTLFEEDLKRSLEAISRHTSRKIRGHRASNFSVVPATLWALEIMARNGIEYDSSVFPFARSRYGIAGYPNPLPHAVELGSGSTLLEFPMSTVKWGRRTLPIAGGGYFRLYPRRVTEGYIEASNRRGVPAMVYLHPWEIDASQKRHPLGLWKGFQHYVNLDQTEWKLNRLLQRFEFSSIADSLELPRVQSLLRRNPVQVRSMGGETVAAAGAGTALPEAPILLPAPLPPARGTSPAPAADEEELETVGADPFDPFGRRGA